jgi:hypothetical protein
MIANPNENSGLNKTKKGEGKLANDNYLGEAVSVAGKLNTD